MRFNNFAFALALVRWCSAHSFDLGDLTQYQSQLTEELSLTGSTIWLSGQASNGFDFALSADAQAKVQGVLSGCSTVNDQCFQDLNNVLVQSELLIDPQLEKRAFIHMLSKTFKRPIALLATILITFYIGKHVDEQFAKIHVPEPIAEAAEAFGTAGATVTVVQHGTPVVTVTPTPALTTLLGPSRPSVTAVTTPHDGQEIGDLVAVLDEDLARRIDEIIRRSGMCKDGKDFDVSQGSSRVELSLGGAICGAQAVAGQAVPGGPLNDIMFLDPAGVHFNFVEGVAPLRAASQVVVDFVLDYAPLLTPPVLPNVPHPPEILDPQALTAMAEFIFALAIRVAIDNVLLGAQNIIHAAQIVQEGTPTTGPTQPPTPSSCPGEDKMPKCGSDDADCDIQLPKSSAIESFATCKTGEYAGCRCLTPLDADFDETYPGEVEDLLYSAQLFGSSPSITPSPVCESSNMTEIPATVFSSDRGDVFSKFCNSWGQTASYQVIVNPAGDAFLPTPHMRITGKRSPPANPGSWSQYQFTLGYYPKDGGKGKCSADCLSAFKQLGNACRQNGAMDPKLAATGSLDAGCGIFSYAISKSDLSTLPSAIKIYDRVCFDASTIPPHGVIERDFQDYLGSLVIGMHADRIIKPGDVAITEVFDVDGTPYNYSFYWEAGCTLEVGEQSQALVDPMKKGDAAGQPRILAEDLLRDNYALCDNQAAGGKIRVGCVTYRWLPQF